MFDDFFMKSFYNLNLIITNEKWELGEKRKRERRKRELNDKWKRQTKKSNKKINRKKNAEEHLTTLKSTKKVIRNREEREKRHTRTRIEALKRVNEHCLFIIHIIIVKIIFLFGFLCVSISRRQMGWDKHKYHPKNFHLSPLFNLRNIIILKPTENV